MIQEYTRSNKRNNRITNKYKLPNDRKVMNEALNPEQQLDVILDKMFIDTPELVKPNLTKLPIKYHVSATIKMECLGVSKGNAIKRAMILTRGMFNTFNVIGESKKFKYVEYQLDASQDVNANMFQIMLDEALKLEDTSKYKTLRDGKVEQKHAFTIGTPVGEINFNYNKYTKLVKTATYTLYLEMFAVPDINIGISAIRHQRDAISSILGTLANKIDNGINTVEVISFPNFLTLD